MPARSTSPTRNLPAFTVESSATERLDAWCKEAGLAVADLVDHLVAGEPLPDAAGAAFPVPTYVTEWTR